MRGVVQKRKAFVAILVSGLLLLAFQSWNRGTSSIVVDERKDPGPEIESLLAKRLLREPAGPQDRIPYRVKESVASRLALNRCVCEGEKAVWNLPLAHLLFPRVWAVNLTQAVQDAALRSRRAREYHSFQRRTWNAADGLVIAEANSPLQYPTQGLAVRPLKTIIIAGLGLKEEPKRHHEVNLTATMGTFDVAATVAAVTITGEGQMHLTLSSPHLPALNRQLQFITYTNTRFHPRTADTVQFETYGHHSVFTIKVGHAVTPKLQPGSGGDYNVSSLVTIATKTFLRYDKLQDLIDSIRLYYPDVTIVIADDNEHPKSIRGHRIEHYIMPFGKGWFAGRNLAVSQVTTKYVLWADDDFIFTANTKLEKMLDVLEKTTLDLVGGAVREVTGYTATFRHTISMEEGGEEGGCIHIRRGHHHAIEGFPNCVVADGVINFFMARTDKVKEVGFDPRLARRAHLEFFVDGLGSLHVGSCSDVIVGHASKIKLPWGRSEDEKAYAKFRYAASDDAQPLNYFYYFKSRLQCMTSN